MKQQRNEICACGSGLKFKRCCGLKESDERSNTRLFRELEAGVIEDMLPFAEEVFGEDALEAAFGLFLESDEDLEYDQDDPLNPMFLPWYVYNWQIESQAERTSPSAPLNQTIAEAYLEAREGTLPAQSVELIKASIRRPLSFFQVLETVPGKSLSLENLLTGDKLVVDEEKASTSLHANDIIIASVLRPFQGKTRAAVIGPFALDEAEKPKILELKKSLKSKGAINETLLLNQEAFVIGLYLDIVDEMADDED